MTDDSFRVNFDTPHITHHDDGTPYDFGSVMHYYPWACANSSLHVITKPDGSPIPLTKTDTFSEWDIKQINYIYDCKLVSSRLSVSIDLILFLIASHKKASNNSISFNWILFGSN